jgi:hypothetical protein
MTAVLPCTPPPSDLAPFDPIDVLAPQVLDCVNRSGPGATISALLSLAMSVAIDWGNPLAISQVFRHDAQILEDYQPHPRPCI